MGTCFNLQRYSTHDGPGIRSVLFLKGCSLHCHWCQNPESQARRTDLLYDPRLCLAGCTLCQQTGHCQRQGETLALAREQLDEAARRQLAQVCPSGALACQGEEWSLARAMTALLADEPFYRRSGGGITLSGGEPFLQHEFASQLLAAAQAQGIHTAVESCLHVPWSHIAACLPHLDLLLADLKQLDETKFAQWTGGQARRVRDNFRRLADQPVSLIVRIALIPGFNASQGELSAMLDFVAHETSAREVHFLPYHTLGRHKYHLLGREYLAPQQPLADEALLEFAQEAARERGLTPVLRGQA